MIWRFVIVTLVVLAALFIFTSQNFGDIIGGPQRAIENVSNETGTKFDLLVDQLFFDIDPQKTSDFWDYRIILTADIRPVGLVEPTDNIFALVSFKGIDSRARLETSQGPQETFSVVNADPQKGMRFVADVTSRVPPVKKVNNNYIGPMYLGETFIIESSHERNFQITLREIEETTEGFFDFSERCDPIFIVGCAKNAFVRQRIKLTESCPLGEYNDNCRKTVDICEGAVTITLIENTACSEVEKVELFVEGGQLEEEEKHVGEELAISFFLDNICTNPLETYEEMKRNCQKSFLGGRYDFVKPVSEL